MSEPNQSAAIERDEGIKNALKEVLGMSVPKYISIIYGRSQKAAQIMFNQPETRKEKDEQLLDDIWELCQDRDRLSAHFVTHILGSDRDVLQNIQTTIDSRFQSMEADNTVKGLSRPMLSDYPEIRQLEMINDKYFYNAVDMQRDWSTARKKQSESHGKPSVRIPYTMEQIKSAFMVVIDMCRLIIDLKSTENKPRAREALARAYALSAAAAIQMGRYDIVESHLAEWRDQFELHKDEAIPLRVRNLLIQKELWLLKRKGEFGRGLEIAENQWSRCKKSESHPLWVDLEPLACAGLELAAMKLKTIKSGSDNKSPEDLDQLRDIVNQWLSRFENAADRAEEIGEYLQEDPELEALRDDEEKPNYNTIWSQLMKKFGVITLVVAFFLSIGALSAPAINSADDHTSMTTVQSPVNITADAANWDAGVNDVIVTAGANPGKLIWDFFRNLFSIFTAGYPTGSSNSDYC